MTSEEKAAFIHAQTEIMVNERYSMLSENTMREIQGFSPANGPIQWTEFNNRWESILGYNALINFFRNC